MAFVRKTEAGRFRGVAKSGRTVIGTKTFDTKRQAMSWAERLEALSAGGVNVAAGKRALVRELLPEFLAVREGMVTRSTVETDMAMSKRIGALGARSIGSVLPVDVERWFVSLRKVGLRDSSVARYRISLSAFMGWAIAEGYRSDNPARVARLPALVDPPSEMRPLLGEDLSALEKRVRCDRSSHYADVLIVLGWTGLRWSEARELRVKDLQLGVNPAARISRACPEGQAVKIVKGRKSRRVPLANPALEAIERLRTGKGRDDLVLTSERGARLWRAAFIKASGFAEFAPGFSLHGLRHGAACTWLMASIDIVTVQHWLGHASVTTTGGYLHWLGSRADEAALKLLNSSGGAPGVRAPIHSDEEFTSK